MEHCYYDDITHNVLEYLKDNYPSAVQKTSGVPIVSHVRNCHNILKACGWPDQFHWHPMLELCKLETLEEETTWQKFVGPYNDQDYAQQQREHFGLFFRRCCFLAKKVSFQSPEKFYWLAGRCQNETWGIMITDVMAVSDELKAAERMDDALACIRQGAPLYLLKSHFSHCEIPAEQQPTDEELNEAWSILGLTKTEEETIRYWDDLYNFEQRCTFSPKGAWLKRWHDLGGKDFWEIY